MIQSIALDAPQVPENAISSQETGAEKKGCDKFNVIGLIALIGLVILLPSAITCLVTKLNISHQCSQCCCPDEWISFQDHCYYFSNHERSWTSSKNYCIAEDAHLTVINNTTKMMDFLRQHKCTSDHWIGLMTEGSQMGKWENKAIFNQSFKVSENETCAYLGDDGVAKARCYTERKFICMKKKTLGRRDKEELSPGAI